MAEFPGIAGLAEIADGGLHRAVQAWVPRPERLDALREQLRWEVDVAGRDLEWARDFAVHQPASGAPAEMFLNRWLPAGDDLTVLAGPRYEDRHPDRPFVEVVAADRLLTAADLPALRRLARDDFAVFHPLDLRVWTADAPGTWPGTRAEMRLVAAPLGQLRRRDVADEVTVRPAADLSWYDRYVAAHDRHVTADPAHADRSRVETAADLDALREAGDPVRGPRRRELGRSPRRRTRRRARPARSNRRRTPAHPRGTRPRTRRRPVRAPRVEPADVRRPGAVRDHPHRQPERPPIRPLRRPHRRRRQGRHPAHRLTARRLPLRPTNSTSSAVDGAEPRRAGPTAHTTHHRPFPGCGTRPPAKIVSLVPRS